MFTDGLDHNALQWVRKEERATSGSPAVSGEPSLSLGRRDLGSLSGRGRSTNWGLPPSQLANVHMHSGLLRSTLPAGHKESTSEDLEESVGSISGGFNDDSFDTESGESGDSSFAESPAKNGDPSAKYLRNYVTHKFEHRYVESLSPRARKTGAFADDDRYVVHNSRNDEYSLSEQQAGSRQDAQYRGFSSEYDRQQQQQSQSKANIGIPDSQQIQSGAIGSGRRRSEGWDYNHEGVGQRSQSGGGDSFYTASRDRFNPVTDTNDNNSEKTAARTQISSDAESSDEEEIGENVENVPPPNKLGNYPVIGVEHLSQGFLKDPRNRGLDIRAAGVQREVEKENVGGGVERNGSARSLSRPWLSASHLNCEDPKPSEDIRRSAEDLRRSQSDTATLPPSAPPMSASMAMEPEVTAPKPAASGAASGLNSMTYQKDAEQSVPSGPPEQSSRAISGAQVEGPSLSTKHRSTGSSSHPPTIHLSGQDGWQAMIAYDACVRLCLGAWARGCPEAPEFLQDECSMLRESFGLQQLLLQPYEELKRKGASKDTEATAASKPKRNVGKLKVQVCKFKMSKSKLPTGCTCPSLRPIKFASLYTSVDDRSSNKPEPLLTGWAAVRKLRVIQRTLMRGNASQRSLQYVSAGAQYMRQVSGLLKDKVNSLRTNSLDGPQDGMSCVLKLKSSTNEEAVRMHPGSGESTVFLFESAADELVIDVQDLNGASQGRCGVPLSSISDDPTDRVRWFSIYAEPEHECVGKIQLSVGFLTSGDVGAAKGPGALVMSGRWGAVGETLAYDIVLEVAMRAQGFQRRNLRLQGSWGWLLSQFATYYGVSEAYTKLRYLASVMEVATPTEDCLVLIYDLICPIIKSRDEGSLDRQEKRILAEVEDQVSQLLTLVFENYKSLDEASSVGLSDIFPANNAAAPALGPAVQIYTLLHDILTLDAQITLRNYFKTAAKKRLKRHMAETDEFVSSTNDGFLMDPLTMATAYQKMKMLCLNIGSEVHTDIDIHNQHVLPSPIDLPNVAAMVYNMELCSRLRSFLVACPPTGPTAPVAELMLATADFQQNLISWGIRPCKGGVDANELFHLYIVLWIQDKRLQLLDFCKLDKDRYMWVTTQNVTVPFVEEMYERIRDTLAEYEVIINRWPEYTIALEIALADVERAIITAIEKQYADVLTPLRDVMIPKKFSIQYMQKLTRRRSICLYSVPSQLGVMLNSIKRLLDTLRPKVELHMKAWVACLPADRGVVGKSVFGEHLNEVTIEVRAKYKTYLHAIVEKLADNARLQRATKLKKILQDTREAGGESDIRERMQPLSNQLVETISHLHEVFASRVFVAVCRGYWDRMARDVLNFLENRKENRSWYKGSSIALGILDDIFASQMQRLQGHALQEKDLDPPRSVMEARTMLSKDAPNGNDSSTLFFY